VGPDRHVSRVEPGPRNRREVGSAAREPRDPVEMAVVVVRCAAAVGRQLPGELARAATAARYVIRALFKAIIWLLPFLALFWRAATHEVLCFVSEMRHMPLLCTPV
jgi:hypothetical protein